MSGALRCLGLDLGRNTGYCISEGEKVIASGVRDFSVKPHHHDGRKFNMLYNWLAKEVGPITEIYYEKIMFTGKFNCSDGHELYNGLKAAMNMYADDIGIPTYGVWPGTLKKAFAGSGVAEKEDMCKAAHQIGWRGGMPGTDIQNDEADAIGLVATQLRQRYNIHLTF